MTGTTLMFVISKFKNDNSIFYLLGAKKILTLTHTPTWYSIEIQFFAQYKPKQ